MSASIVDQIRTLIRGQQLVPGDRLPSERALGERLRVSRATVRQALKVLEASGLIEIRVGSRGGAFVIDPPWTRVASGLADLVTLSALTAVELAEARQVIEVGIVPLVVARATVRDIAELRGMLDRNSVAVTNGEFGMSMSALFHVRVVACAHNAAVERLVRSVRGPLLMSLRKAHVARVAAPMTRRGVIDHRALVDAIAARDIARATDIMRSHLERTAARLARFERPPMGPR